LVGLRFALFVALWIVGGIGGMVHGFSYTHQVSCFGEGPEAQEHFERAGAGNSTGSKAQDKAQESRSRVCDRSRLSAHVGQCCSEHKAKHVLCHDGRGPQARDRHHGAILASLHMRTADDLFGGPMGSPRTDKLIAASVQWAQEIVKKVDDVCGPRS
jgi:hypothetical protein